MPTTDVVIVGAARTPIGRYGGSFKDLHPAELGAVAANVLARAVARGVYEATTLPFAGAQPSWKDRFGK